MSARPMAAGLQVDSVRRQTAAIFGAMVGRNGRVELAGVTWRMGRACGVPYLSITAAASVRSRSMPDHGGRERGSGKILVDDGLDAVQAAVSVADDGDAAPARMTTAPLPASGLIMSSSGIRWIGEGMTLRQAAVHADIQPWSADSCFAVGSS